MFDPQIVIGRRYASSLRKNLIMRAGYCDAHDANSPAVSSRRGGRVRVDVAGFRRENRVDSFPSRRRYVIADRKTVCIAAKDQFGAEVF
jgi:hypothetical protein